MRIYVVFQIYQNGVLLQVGKTEFTLEFTKGETSSEIFMLIEKRLHQYHEITENQKLIIINIINLDQIFNHG